MSDIKDQALAKEGVRRIEWAERDMPVLRVVRERFEKEMPFKGKTLAAVLHVTAETANLVRTLKAGGCTVFLAASNPLSTQDDVAAALVSEYGIETFAIKGESTETFFQHIDAAIQQKHVAHFMQLVRDAGGKCFVLHDQENFIFFGIHQELPGTIFAINSVMSSC